jgi:2-polyprenyl-3-methyl-5-hydroxy-6-metoxy-1,4-benzoquinol methylase
MQDSSQEMHAYYAERAPYYDSVYLKPERQADIAFLCTFLPERFVERNVLEIACGTGYWTQHIAKSAHRIVATDGTAEPLEFAKLRPTHRCAVEYHLADAYTLDPQLGRFNACFAGLWLSHVPIQSRNAFFSGLHQRLQPGSRIVLIDNNHTQLGDFPIAETDIHGNTYQHRTLTDGSVHRVLKNFPSEQELRDLILPFASYFEWRDLDNFWLLEYELDGTA